MHERVILTFLTEGVVKAHIVESRGCWLCGLHANSEARCFGMPQRISMLDFRRFCGSGCVSHGRLIAVHTEDIRHLLLLLLRGLLFMNFLSGGSRRLLNLGLDNDLFRQLEWNNFGTVYLLTLADEFNID